MAETDSSTRFPAALIRVLAVASSWGFAFSSFYLLPKFLHVELGASPAAIGFVVGLFGWTTVFTAPAAGALLDRWPLRRSMIVGTLGTAIICFAFTTVKTVGPWLYGLRIALSAAHALVFTAIGVAVAGLAPSERLSQGLGFSGASMLVMNAISPAILEPIAERYGWPITFAVSGSMAMLSCVLAFSLPAPGSEPLVSRRSDALMTILARPLARDFATISALAGLAFGTMMTFEPPYALALGRAQVRGFFIAYAAGALAVRLLLGHLPDRLGRHRVAVASFAFYAAIVAATGIVPASALELVGLGFGVAHGLFYPSLNAIALAGSPPHERGRILALFTAAFYLGFAGPSLLGPLADRAGYAPVFWLIGATTAAGVALLARSRALAGSGARRVTDAVTAIAPEIAERV
jgi:MFS family permease